MHDNNVINKGKKELEKKQFDILNFTIEIKKQAWDKIRPEERIYADNRVYHSLRPPWTDYVYFAIYYQEKLPCPYAFDHQYFYKVPYLPYFLFTGYCDGCSNSIIGCIEKEPEENCESIKIKIQTGNSRNITHFNRRKISGELRTEAKKILLYEKPKLYKEKLASEKLSDSGKGIELLNNTFRYIKFFFNL